MRVFSFLERCVALVVCSCAWHDDICKDGSEEMKLTEKGKEVWERPVYPDIWQYQNPPQGPTGIIAERVGTPFGWTVAREALGGMLDSYDERDTHFFVDAAADIAIALCNKLAEVEWLLASQK